MTVNSYRFSIIIPLEFHRGQAFRCIQGWAREQSLSRNVYQLLIAVPEHFSISELHSVQSLLLPQDRIEHFSHLHDMDLIAAMSKFAEGEFLLFTESHAFPQMDTLQHLYQVVEDHPEWPGFSFRSVPLTYNLLSKIEAKMYLKHIENNRLNHPWLKVLDQCFVIKKEVYWSVGGIEPKYGHFAEWLFAARLFRAGFLIQIDNSSSIHHYYVGKLRDLELFTLDFTRGEMLFATERQNDPCAKMFQEIPELLAYRHWYRKDSYRFLKLKIRFLFQLMQGTHQANLSSVWKDFAQSIGIAGIGIQGIYVVKCCSTWILKKQLQFFLRIQQAEKAELLFLRWIKNLITRERLHYLCDPIVQQQQMSVHRQKTNERFYWEPDGGYELDLLGFYGLEYYDDRAFQWTAHCAAINLYLEMGNYRIEISWLAIRVLNDNHQLGLNFFLNEQKLDASYVILKSCGAIIEIQVKTAQEYRLSWTLMPLQFSGDQRLLGLPVYLITWN